MKRTKTAKKEKIRQKDSKRCIQSIQSYTLAYAPSFLGRLRLPPCLSSLRNPQASFSRLKRGKTTNPMQGTMGWYPSLFDGYALAICLWHKALIHA